MRLGHGMRLSLGLWLSLDSGGSWSLDRGVVDELLELVPNFLVIGLVHLVLES